MDTIDLLSLLPCMHACSLQPAFLQRHICGSAWSRYLCAVYPIQEQLEMDTIDLLSRLPCIDARSLQPAIPQRHICGSAWSLYHYAVYPYGAFVLIIDLEMQHTPRSSTSLRA